jgi:mRNA interferase RelE/StbE
MKLKIDKSFEKDTNSLNDRTLNVKIITLIKNLINANSLNDIKNIKKLKGHNNSYRIKLGDYRIGFEYIVDTVVLVRFLHRKDIYKHFPKN